MIRVCFAFGLAIFSAHAQNCPGPNGTIVDCPPQKAGSPSSGGYNPDYGDRTAYEQVCLGRDNTNRPRGKTVYDDYPPDMRLFQQGACGILALIDDGSRPDMVARLVPVLDKENAASASFLRRLGAVLSLLKGSKLESFNIVEENTLKALSDNFTHLAKGTVLSCFAPKDITEGSQIQCELTDGGSKPLGMVAWAIPSAHPAALTVEPTAVRETEQQSDLDGMELARHGSDKIEIAWNIGRAVGAHLMGPSSPEEAKRNRDEFESDETAKAFMEQCPGKLTRETIKKLAESVTTSMDDITIHLFQMRASTEFMSLTKTVSQLLSAKSLDEATEGSLDAFKAPRQIVDAYRAGFYSVSLELYGITSCGHQQWLKVPQCPALTSKLQTSVARMDGDWKGRLEAILSDYGLSLKLPLVDCSAASNEALVRYVESLKRAAWKAMRTRFDQERKASATASPAKPVNGKQ